MEVSREFILRITRQCGFVSEKLEKTTATLNRIMKQIEELDKEGNLTIPYLKKRTATGASEISDRQYEVKRSDYLYPIYENFMEPIDKLCWSDYFLSIKKFNLTVADFNDFIDRYKYFVPKNREQIENLVRNELRKKGFIVDSYFEGDYDTWIGVYARPKDKPTYLDPATAEEARLQDKYRVDGFKQDFSEWFEWKIKNGEIINQL
ncbi:Phi-29-like late activator [Enterococcus faecium]|uniref:Phi-29-like late activator n=1 Tax=Enterococcus faecium TaxID=1352 RepID=UPI002A821045|nr:Phi-29-like late activator [Enterococcus faecium]MDY5174587.1 Phi-29-like late activator [Enterococcus faecium]